MSTSSLPVPASASARENVASSHTISRAGNTSRRRKKQRLPGFIDQGNSIGLSNLASRPSVSSSRRHGDLISSVFMPTRVVVLGAGFGGLELTTILSEEFGKAIDVVLIDKGDAFIFGFSKLDVMFGRQPLAAVRHPYKDFLKPGVRFSQTTIRSIDPATRRTVTDAGTFDADILVVA